MRRIDHLRSHVVWCPGLRVCLAHHESCQAHVADLSVTPGVQHDVLRLEISVDDLSLVQMLQSRDHTAGIEGRGVATRLVSKKDVLVGAEEPIEISSKSSLQQEVDELLVLHGLVQADDETAVQHVEKIPLPAKRLAGPTPQCMAFRHPLQRIALLRRLVLYQEDRAEGTLTQTTNLFHRMDSGAAFKLLTAFAGLDLLPLTHISVHIGEHRRIAEG
mmetsp:Transcript_48516/g.115506  ORF Transcript_48516/g.115506 Transcript_48516/m.115506 type:complete len:217 (-) Transcript_48516:1314-1964(-)